MLVESAELPREEVYLVRVRNAPRPRHHSCQAGRKILGAEQRIPSVTDRPSSSSPAATANVYASGVALCTRRVSKHRIRRRRIVDARDIANLEDEPAAWLQLSPKLHADPPAVA